MTASFVQPYAPAQAKDSRSPCPALNALANHGYMCVILYIHIRFAHRHAFLALIAAVGYLHISLRKLCVTSTTFPFPSVLSFESLLSLVQCQPLQ